MHEMRLLRLRKQTHFRAFDERSDRESEGFRGSARRQGGKGEATEKAEEKFYYGRYEFDSRYCARCSKAIL